MDSDKRNVNQGNHNAASLEAALFRKEPVRLIYLDESDQTFKTNEPGLNVIRKLKVDGNYEQPGIAIVSVNGVQRTGKSYLLNQLVKLISEGEQFNPDSGRQAGIPPQQPDDEDQKQQFVISSKTQSCTQGIWLWGEPIYMRERNMYMILVDCEGFGSLNQTESHDARVFCLSVLLSSLIIFNSMQVIDEKNIESLSLASELAHKVLSTDNQDGGDSKQSSRDQVFVWLVRDQALQLKNKEGQMMTTKEYLESRISNSKFKDKLSRRVIQQTFQRRECFTLVRPVKDERQLKNLGYPGHEHELRPEFVDGLNKLKDFIVQESPTIKTPIQTDNNILNMQPDILVALIEQYVEQINSSCPSIPGAWDDIIKKQIQQTDQKVQEFIQNEFTSFSDALQPTDTANVHLRLIEIHQQWKDMVTSALKPLVPSYFTSNEDPSKSGNIGIDENQKELFSKIDKVINNCNKKFNSEKVAIIEKNTRKNAQNFNQLEQQCFKPFQQKMNATKQAISQYVQPSSQSTNNSSNYLQTASFKSVDEINEGFKVYVQSLSKLIKEMGLDEKLCYDQYQILLPGRLNQCMQTVEYLVTLQKRAHESVLLESLQDQEKVLRDKTKKLDMIKKENEALDEQLQEANKMLQVTTEQRDIKRKELDDYKGKSGPAASKNINDKQHSRNASSASKQVNDLMK